MRPNPRIARLLLLGSLGFSLVAERPMLDRDLDRLERQGAQVVDADGDDATARREWAKEWFGEWTPEFRQFMLGAASLERSRHAAKMPGALGDTEQAFVAATGSTWVNIGPTNADTETNGSTLNVRDSGRPVSIVPDPTNPQVIYVATDGGGVWKTTNGGAAWAPLTETLGTLSCGFLTLDPNNSSTLYLGLGDAFDGTGVGLVKSTDGGATWSAPVFLGTSTVINSVQVCSTNSSVVLVNTNQGLFRSNDGGASFAAVSLATGQTAVPYGWALAWAGGSNYVLSLEANSAATTGTTDGQIWYSSDNGGSWAKATGVTNKLGVGRISIASAPSSRSTLFAMAAVPLATTASDLADLFKSTDGGHTWVAQGITSRTKYSKINTESSLVQKILNGQGWYNHMIIVNPTDPNTVYIGGALLMAKFNAATKTYTQMTNWLAQFSLPYVHADFHCAAFDAAGNFYVGTDGGFFKSSDAGTTWTSNLNIGLTTHLIYSVGSSLANRSAVIGGFQDNGTRVRSGATSTFNQQIGGDGFGSNIHPITPTNMLGSLYYTRIYKSTNGGSTFAAANSGITESNNSSSAPFNTVIRSWDGDSTGNTIYTTANTKVYKSTNYAGSWTALGVTGLPTTSLYIRNVGVAKTSSSTVGVVTNGGRAFLTANAGASWTQVGAIPNNGSYMSWVSFDPTNSSTVYLASVAPDATKNHLWKSNDFGVTWTTIDGGGFPAGVPVNTISTDPNDHLTLYAGTHMGLYKSTDGGATWTRFGSGLPLVNVTDVYVSPDSSLVRVSTFGRGFWELQP